MDEIFPILPQTNGAIGAGQSSAPDAADAGAFDALLAAQTSPVAPVPAIPSRPNGGNAFAATTRSAAGTATVTSGQTQAATPADAAALPANANAAIAQAPNESTSPTATATAAATPSPASPTTGVAAHSGVAPTATPVAATTVAAGHTHSQPGKGGATAPSVDAASAPLIESGQKAVSTGNALAASQSGHTAAASDQMALESAAKETVGQPAVPAANAKANPDASVKNNVTPSANAAAKGGETATTTGVDSTQRNAANTQPAADAVSAATTQAASGQTASVTAASVPQPAVQAGVQARRDAAGTEKAPIATTGQATKNTASGAANSSTSTATSTPATKPDITIPAQTPTPQAAQPPAEALPDPARLAIAENTRPAPPPLDAGQTDPAADSDRLDLSNLRAAENSRAAERPGTAAGTARFTPANAGTLAAQIAAKFQNGDRKFEIRMDPPELGRIQVKMHVGNDNRVQAILSAERPETLNDLRQHARELERALEESGLQLDNDGLSFELSQGGDQDEHTPRNLPGFTNIEFTEDLTGPITAAALPRELYGFRLSAASRVDVRL